MPVNAPSAISTSMTVGRDFRTLTITGAVGVPPTRAGTYYFSVKIDSVESNVEAFTVVNQ
jgi:hypothetical protein